MVIAFALYMLANFLNRTFQLINFQDHPVISGALNSKG